MRDVFRQLGAGVRFDWGPAGADALAADRGCLVVIDVMSFTTSVSIAVSKGIDVYPYRWRDESAVAFAREHDAELAVDRSAATVDHPWTLSPAALMQAPGIDRLVLPSPNGSTISFGAKTFAVSGSFRNGEAIADRLFQAGYGTVERPIVVIASGERWESDGSLRPCIEDFLCAGHIVDALTKRGCKLSTEANVARSAYLAVTNLLDVFVTSASGRELIEMGFEQDVVLATEVGADDVVPKLSQGCFRDADVAELIAASESATPPT